MPHLFTILFIGWLFTILPALAEWETWKGCRLISNASNDGDSFHVSYNGNEYIVRLYFVDAPETDTTNRGADRQVADQAAHFGKTAAETLHIGNYAKQATAQLLSRPFTVTTKGTDARGNSSIGRIFGFVTTSDGSDLAETLIASGLARSYGMAEAPPGKERDQLRARYDRLEAQARSKQLGLYSANPLNSIARVSAPPSTVETTESPKTAPKADSTPDRSTLIGPDVVVTPYQAPTVTWNFTEPGTKPAKPDPKPAPEPIAAAKSLSGKINLNTASEAELRSIPGIGPALSQRLIAARPFNSIEDLSRVKGIGPAKLAELKQTTIVE